VYAGIGHQAPRACAFLPISTYSSIPNASQYLYNSSLKLLYQTFMLPIPFQGDQIHALTTVRVKYFIMVLMLFDSLFVYGSHFIPTISMRTPCTLLFIVDVQSSGTNHREVRANDTPAHRDVHAALPTRSHQVRPEQHAHPKCPSQVSLEQHGTPSTQAKKSVLGVAQYVIHGEGTTAGQPPMVKSPGDTSQE